MLPLISLLNVSREATLVFMVASRLITPGDNGPGCIVELLTPPSTRPAQIPLFSSSVYLLCHSSRAHIWQATHALAQMNDNNRTTAALDKSARAAAHKEEPLVHKRGSDRHRGGVKVRMAKNLKEQSKRHHRFFFSQKI